MWPAPHFRLHSENVARTSHAPPMPGTHDFYGGPRAVLASAWEDLDWHSNGALLPSPSASFERPGSFDAAAALACQIPSPVTSMSIKTLKTTLRAHAVPLGALREKSELIAAAAAALRPKSQRHRGLGNAAIKRGAFSLAVRQYTLALVWLDVTDTPAGPSSSLDRSLILQNRSLAYLKLLFFASSSADALSASVLNPLSHKAPWRLGAAAEAARQWAGAAAAYAASAALQPADAQDKTCSDALERVQKKLLEEEEEEAGGPGPAPSTTTEKIDSLPSSPPARPAAAACLPTPTPNLLCGLSDDVLLEILTARSTPRSSSSSSSSAAVATTILSPSELAGVVAPSCHSLRDLILGAPLQTQLLPPARGAGATNPGGNTSSGASGATQQAHSEPSNGSSAFEPAGGEQQHQSVWQHQCFNQWPAAADRVAKTTGSTKPVDWRALCCEFTATDSAWRRAAPVPAANMHRMRQGSKGTGASAATTFGVSLSPDGLTLVSTDSESVHVWDMATRTCVRSFEGAHTRGMVLGCFVHPDGSKAASGGSDSLMLWDGINVDGSGASASAGVAGGGGGKRLSGHDGPIVSLTGTSRHLFSTGFDGLVKIWDWETGRCCSAMAGHQGHTCGISVESSGNSLGGSGGISGDRVWTGADDSTVKCWDVEREACTTTLEGHTGSVWAVVSASPSLLVSGATDGVIRLWDIRQNRGGFAAGGSGAMVTGHQGPIGGLFIDDSKMLSCSFDGTFRVWDWRFVRDSKAVSVTLLPATSEGQRGRATRMAVHGTTVAIGNLELGVMVLDLL